MSSSLWPHGMQQARLPCPSLPPGVCSDSWPLSWWCYLSISSSATFFSFSLQSFPASGSFPKSCLFASGGQSIGASTLASVLPLNIQVWFPLGPTGLISLQGTLKVSTELVINRSCFLFWVQLLAWRESFCFLSVMDSPLGFWLVFTQLPNLLQIILSSQHLLVSLKWHTACLDQLESSWLALEALSHRTQANVKCTLPLKHTHKCQELYLFLSDNGLNQ